MRSRALLSLATAAAMAACGPARGSRSPGAPPRQAPPQATVPAVATAPRPPEDVAPTASASPRAPTELARPFPPGDVAPPHAKSRADGDGHWTLLGDETSSDLAAVEPRVIARTVVHPHPDSRWITVTIAAIDLRRVRLRLAPGTGDLEWARLPLTPISGLVSPDDRARVLAVMNGGFQPQHGRWGLVAGTVTVNPPREGGCTVAVYRNGKVAIAPWSALSADVAELEVIRQTPPCLVSGGALHPSLLAGRDKAWAGHVADLTTRRRSAVGIDADGEVLFYALGEEAEPRWLAEALHLVGAAAAAELDINWYWTRFLLVGRDANGLRITGSLVPKMEHQPTEYVERPSTRDFFYVVRKQ